jgi:hypothetical protein
MFLRECSNFSRKSIKDVQGSIPDDAEENKKARNFSARAF